ncbi:MAG: reverse transcriptase domain-containing protein [Candidatus Thiodiazotropha sp.]
MRLTLDICNGFNERVHTAALFIDIAKAYNSVWREGLMFKLQKMGISGRIWYWIRDFLTERTASINFNSVRVPEFSISIGLSQGSVILPLLFSLYIANCYENVKCEKVKFADGTIWTPGKNHTELTENLKEDLRQDLLWASKWRLKLGIVKIEFCIFFSR